MKNMKKRCLSLALSFCLLLSLLPMPARAAGTLSCDGTHGDGWTEISSLGGTLSGGKYYLSGNVTASEDITISGNVTLCLKGNELNLHYEPKFGSDKYYCIQVTNGASLTICDCKTSGTITGCNSTINDKKNGAVEVNGGTLALESGSISDNSIPGVSVINGGSFTMSGGTISGNERGVSVVGTNSKFEMTGGTISNSTANDSSGVSVSSGGTFEMTGGTISENTALGSSGVSVGTSSSFTMSGGTISDNTGGVSVKDSGNFTMSGDAQITGNNERGVSVSTSGRFTMSDGTISGNNGGVSVSSGTFNMSGGAISGNTCQNGSSGGVSVSSGTFNMSGEAEITGNTGNSGGGVYVSGDGTFHMSGNARITGNTAVESGGGVEISNAGGTTASVTLSGGVQITGNTAGTGDTATDSNLYIPSTRTINIGGEGLTGGARIGVCTNDYPNPGQTRAITTATDSDNLAYFTSDAPDKSSIVYKDGAIHLSGDPTHSHKLSFNYAPITTIGGTLSEGRYHLKENVTASDNITIDGVAVYLCLNGKNLDLDGHTITVESGSLFIYDCADNYRGSGKITDGPADFSAITVNGGSLTLGSGTITGNPGGGIRVNSNGHLKVHEANNEGNGTVNVTDNGNSNVSLTEGSKINIGFAAGRLFNIGVTMDAPGVFTDGWRTHMSDVDDPTKYFASDNGQYGIIKNDSGELMLEQLHEHEYTYSVSTDDGSTIIESCSCGHSATATLSAPTSLTYDGSQKEANVMYSTGEDGKNAWVGGDLTITYQKAGESLNAAPTDAGTYTATITKDTATASVEFTIKKADQKPPTSSDYTIDYIGEKIADIADGCKVYTAQTGGTEVTAGSLISDYLGGSLYIRKEATNNYNASGWTTINLIARPDAPTVTAVPESIKGKGDGKVTGVNDAMEYSTDNGQTWMPCTGDVITGLAAGTTVKVRVKATAAAPHGKESTCTVEASENTLTVTFEENGGSAVDSISGLSYNETISAPTAPTKSGYTFAGWYKEDTYTTLWDFETDKVTNNITLYAKWVLEAPTVELKATTENDGIYNGGETVITLTAMASHSGGELTYAWYKDGSPLSDETEQTLTLTEVADSGNYRVVVTVTDGDGKEATAEASLEVTITPTPVPIPVEDDTQYTYTGTAQTYQIVTDDLYTVSGNTQTNAGTYPVTVSLKDKANYIWASGDTNDLEYTFTINQKAIAVTWSGLDQVYGTKEDVKVTLSGVVDNDDVTAAVNEAIPGHTGVYKLTATLHGKDAPNYTLKNGIETLTIQKKPVVITVTNNVTTTDNVTPPTIQAPDGLTDNDYQIIYKDEEGDVVASPDEPGSYEVWVKFPDGSGYRHPDGSSEAQVGSFIIADTMPTLYTVTFTGNDANTGSITNLEAVSGSVLTLPECSFDKTDSQFTGWSYGGKTYQPGDSFTMPAQNVTFTAQWKQTYGITVTVQEPKPEGEEMQKVSDAVVSLWLGANKLDEQTTTADDTYAFADLLPGIYNLVVTKDDRTITKKVEIKDHDAACDAVLPKGATNSIVKVTEGSPDIVVGKLDTIFEKIDDTVYTLSDANTVTEGGKVEFTFTADEKQQGEDTTTDRDVEKISETNSDSVTLGLVMDYTLTKEVFDKNGNEIKGESKLIRQSTVPLEILLPLPAELQGKPSYTIYRVHDGEVQELTMTPNTLEEYFTVNNDKTGLTLHVKCFSTYVVGYGDESSTPTIPSLPGYPPVKTESENGTFTVSPSRPSLGQPVTIAPKPDEGYQVGTVTVTDQDGNSVKVTVKSDGTYTFTQPSGSVTITVTFRRITSVSDCPRDETCPLAAFTDVNVNAWYHDGVHYCVEYGLMSGYGNGIFGPNNHLSRGMLAQILYNLEGCPTTSGKGVFEDVAPNAWYADAVNWAASVGIVAGYGNGKYGPNDPITREQLATILYHYAQYKGYDVSVGENTDLKNYTDASEISEYAIPAMRWACGAGVISGVTTATLVPGGGATRAQSATMLMLFADNVAR